MASIYDNTNNIYTSDYREIRLTNSGFFYLPDEPAKTVTIVNGEPLAKAIMVAKTTSTTYEPYDSTKDFYQGECAHCYPSGTAYVDGIS